MSWLRVGDNAAVHPIVAKAAHLLRRAVDTVPEREIITNELFGFVTRCATLSTAFDRDYLIDEATAFLVATSRTDRLLELAVKSGYMVKHSRGVYRIVDDPDFLHMRRKAEKDWERQQAADNANPALIVPVRLRDGDSCRYCRVIVNFNDRRGKRGGTYDHRHPGQEAKTPTDLVVACRACNGARGNRPDADTRLPLLDPPAQPFYGNLTASFLASHNITVTPSENLRPGTWPDHATQSDQDTDQESTLTTPATSDPDTDQESTGTTHTQLDHNEGSPHGSADPADTQTEGSGFAGTGRDRGGTGSQVVTNPSATKRKRAPRGKSKPIPRELSEAGADE